MKVGFRADGQREFGLGNGGKSKNEWSEGCYVK